ncbi:hypothetical protein JCM10450v2_002664 [Rhodotorula kratochvilovae]
MATSALAAALTGVLSSLPDGANPFLAADAFAWASRNRNLPDSFFVQLYVVAGLLGFNLVCVLIVCALQIAWRRFWVLRWEDGSFRPHGTVPWQLAGGLFYVFAITTILRSIPYYRGEALVRDLIGWRTFMWWAPWTGGWIAAHALFAGYIQHLLSTGGIDSTRATKAHRRLTVFIFAVLALFFASTGPLAALAVVRYHASLDVFQSIDSQLRTQAATYTGTFSMADLAWLVPAFEELTTKQNKLVSTLRVLYGLYGGWGLVLNIGVDTAAWLHTRSLGRILRETESLRVHSSVSSTDELQTRAFRKTYRVLVVTMWAFTFIALGFTAVSFYVAIETSATMNEPLSIQAVDLVIYLYAALGAPVGILLLIRTVRSRQLAVTTSSSADSPGHGHSLSASRRGGLTRRAVKSHGVAVDVATVITVLERDEPSLHRGEQFEMVVPASTYFADAAEKGPHSVGEDRRAQELYFLDLESKDSRDGSVRSGRAGREKA